MRMNTKDSHPNFKYESFLCTSLHVSHNEEDWMDSLKSLEIMLGTSNFDFDSLVILKSLVPSTVTIVVLRNLVHLFLRKISSMMEVLNITKDSKWALQGLNIVKDFWSLLSNQHTALTQQAFGRYGQIFYEVMPSLTSVYVDLFIAAYSSKSNVEKAAKKLYGWLMFDLNERCIKTALLEVSECTSAGAKILLPLLRKLLFKPPESTNMDYLLHFILLKRWTFVCEELLDLCQMSLNIKAPQNFLEWLTQHWSRAVEYVPRDKSLHDRRVSELLLELDQQAVEELIDVFSLCLSAVKQVPEQLAEEVTSSNEGEIRELFIIDKKGTDKNEMDHTEDTNPGEKKGKMSQNEKEDSTFTDLPGNRIDSKQDGDIFFLSGFLDDSHHLRTGGSKKRKRTSESDEVNLINTDISLDDSNSSEAGKSKRRKRTTANSPVKCINVDLLDDGGFLETGKNKKQRMTFVRDKDRPINVDILDVSSSSETIKSKQQRNTYEGGKDTPIDVNTSDDSSFLEPGKIKRRKRLSASGQDKSVSIDSNITEKITEDEKTLHLSDEEEKTLQITDSDENSSVEEIYPDSSSVDSEMSGNELEIEDNIRTHNTGKNPTYKESIKYTPSKISRSKHIPEISEQCSKARQKQSKIANQDLNSGGGKRTTDMEKKWLESDSSVSNELNIISSSNKDDDVIIQQSFIISSSDEENDIKVKDITIAGQLLLEQRERHKSFEIGATKEQTTPVLEICNAGYKGGQSSVCESEKNTSTASSETEVPALGTVNGGKCGLLRSTEHTVGMVLTHIRKSLNEGNQLTAKNKTKTTPHVKTRLRTKSDSETHVGTPKKVTPNTCKERTSAKNNGIGDLSDWIRKSPARLLNDQASLSSGKIKDGKKTLNPDNGKNTPLTKTDLISKTSIKVSKDGESIRRSLRKQSNRHSDHSSIDFSASFDAIPFTTKTSTPILKSMTPGNKTLAKADSRSDDLQNDSFSNKFSDKAQAKEKNISQSTYTSPVTPRNKLMKTHKEILQDDSVFNTSNSKLEAKDKTPRASASSMSHVTPKNILTKRDTGSDNQPQGPVSNTPNSKTPAKDKKTPKQATTNAASSSSQRYFLRTNCSHRLRNSESVCATCSPDKTKWSPKKKT